MSTGNLFGQRLKHCAEKDHPHCYEEAKISGQPDLSMLSALQILLLTSRKHLIAPLPGNLVEHQVTILEMTSRQSALNGALAFQEPVHRQVTMEIHIDFAFHAGQFPQSGVGFCVSKRRRLTKLSVC